MLRRKYQASVAWLLAVVMLLTPTLTYAQPPAASPPRAAAPAVQLDLSYIPPDAVAAVVACPRRVLTAPEMEMLPVEVLSAAGLKELGFDPVDIEQVLLLAEPPTAGPPQVALALHMAKPLPAGEILPDLWKRTADGDLDGKPYRQAQGPMDASIFRADERTLLIGHDALLRKMVSNHAKPQPGEMSRLLGRIKDPPDIGAVVLVEPLRPLLGMALAQVPLPPPLADLKKTPDLVSSIAARVNLTGEAGMALTLRAPDEAAAEQLQTIIDQALTMAKQVALAEAAKNADSSDPVQQAMGKYTQRVSDRMVQMFRPVRKGATLTLSTSGTGALTANVQVATIGILVALLLPAVQAAREAARRSQSSNNLKQIGLAMHNYYDVHKQLPARASVDKAGKPLLSWRVHILPFLEQQPLYDQFKLDEPWDSEHNAKLLLAMPAVYRNPSGNAPPNKAHYLAVSGKGLMFDGNQGRKFPEIVDGLSNTVMVVEANDDSAVVWTQPDDWEYSAERPLAGLGRAHPGGFSALFGDGSVRFIAQTIDVKVWQAMLTVAGNEVINPLNR